MISPDIKDLMAKMDSRYTLVVTAAKRARQLAAGDARMTKFRSDKPVTLAIHEIAEGRIGYSRDLSAASKKPADGLVGIKTTYGTLGGSIGDEYGAADGDAYAGEYAEIEDGVYADEYAADVDGEYADEFAEPDDEEDFADGIADDDTLDIDADFAESAADDGALDIDADFSDGGDEDLDGGAQYGAEPTSGVADGAAYGIAAEAAEAAEEAQATEEAEEAQAAEVAEVVQVAEEAQAAGGSADEGGEDSGAIADEGIVGEGGA
ncbi:MAG: DNA-directed RNA polymerase subunit omega [Clostridiales bacterium]|nr:DNA-directed RNA polymerase subunit omega [Clostridiales bacterium]